MVGDLLATMLNDRRSFGDRREGERRTEGVPTLTKDTTFCCRTYKKSVTLGACLTCPVQCVVYDALIAQHKERDGDT